MSLAFMCECTLCIITVEISWKNAVRMHFLRKLAVISDRKE